MSKIQISINDTRHCVNILIHVCILCLCYDCNEYKITSLGVQPCRLSQNNMFIKPILFEWRIMGISNMQERRYIYSPSFYLDGYWFRLQTGKIQWQSTSFGLSLFLSVVSLKKERIERSKKRR